MLGNCSLYPVLSVIFALLAFLMAILTLKYINMLYCTVLPSEKRNNFFLLKLHYIAE
jgi:hypothetical protein